jgi:hypothetical protein
MDIETFGTSIITDMGEESDTISDEVLEAPRYGPKLEI